MFMCKINNEYERENFNWVVCRRNNATEIISVWFSHIPFTQRCCLICAIFYGSVFWKKNQFNKRWKIPLKSIFFKYIEALFRYLICEVQRNILLSRLLPEFHSNYIPGKLKSLNTKRNSKSSFFAFQCVPMKNWF